MPISDNTSDNVSDTVLSRAGFGTGETRRRFVELYGSTLVMNTYLQLAVLGLSAVAIGLVVLNVRTQRAFLQVKPLVIRIDDVGRATAVSDASLTYTPQAPELKYFLVQFVTAHYSRIRATVRQQYSESLYFLDGRLADATIDASRKAGTIEKFLTGSNEEIDVHVKSVTLDDLRQPPYRATVEFEQVYLAAATRTELRRETHVAHIVFVLEDHVDNLRIPVNPLGLTITYFREDQAFQDD
ncbi:MAG TPA: VirB8/TrbF family protein [Vicinamibacterales bacterium]|jgi:type IV secretion system protein VirB5|nr:VirB8/TrbF family protein [Vicinamibacterales bacterium]